MLKLIKCEFWKLKRKRLLYALIVIVVIFPLILAYMARRELVQIQQNTIFKPDLIMSIQ